MDFGDKVFNSIFFFEIQLFIVGWWDLWTVDGEGLFYHNKKLCYKIEI
jgi:hypothetical protein